MRIIIGHIKMSQELRSKLIPENINIKIDFDGCIEAEFESMDQHTNETAIGQIIADSHYDNIHNNDNILGTIIFNNGITEGASTSTRCETCGEEFEIYCTKCSMLSHILDKCVSLKITDRPRKTLPGDILGFEQSFCGFGVFALKTIPKNVVFGPIDGLDTITSVGVLTWKVKGGKLVVSPEKSIFSNWMQFINSANHANERNLIIYQCNNYLYYRSEREINEGEELLVYFGDKQEKNKYTDLTILFTPEIDSTTYDIFACTFCCLGFSSKAHLLKHKSVCPNGMDIGCSLNEIVQCKYCQIYLDKEEHIEHHKDYCCAKYCRLKKMNRKYKRKTNNGENNNDANTFDSFRCQICSGTFLCRETLRSHVLNIHRLNKEKYTCPKCNFSTTYKNSIRKHLAIVHSDIKPFECSKCSYKTKTGLELKRHLRVHDGGKLFTCYLCSAEFLQRESLKLHLDTKHNEEFKKYKCENCPFKTNRAHYLQRHQYKHLGLKPFNCNLCKSGFISKTAFEQHVKSTHRGVKPFLCLKCGKGFNRRCSLQLHEKDKHNETGKMDFNCSKCDYQTNRKSNMIRHVGVHVRLTPFLCKICNKEFTTKRAFKIHNKNKHAEDEVTNSRR